MFKLTSDAMLVDDREDLIAVLQMRFGEKSRDLIGDIYEITDMDRLQHLILSAANAANWNVFVEEFRAGDGSFRIAGEHFNPLGDLLKGRDAGNGKA